MIQTLFLPLALRMPTEMRVIGAHPVEHLPLRLTRKRAVQQSVYKLEDSKIQESASQSTT